MAIDFERLVKGLTDNANQGYINIIEMPNSNSMVKLYNYTRKATFEGKWNEWTCKARGLILDLEKKEIIACPFPKFFNYGELPKYHDECIPKQEDFSEFPAGTKITTKMDGSLGILFWYVERWYVSTRGSFTSSQTVWALDWLQRQKKDILGRCRRGITYLFEIIYPENRIVIDYGRTETLILLGAYRSNGEEILDLEKLDIGLDLAPARYFFSANQLIDQCDVIPASEEGYVVRLPNGHRCKFKGIAYTNAHRVREGFSETFVWGNLLKCTLSPKENLPEEFYDEYDKIEQEILLKIGRTLNHIFTLERQNLGREKKEIALDPSLTAETKSLIFLTKDPHWRTLYETPNHKFRKTIFALAQKM